MSRLVRPGPRPTGARRLGGLVLALAAALASALALALFLGPLPGAFGPALRGGGVWLRAALMDPRTWASLRFACLEALASALIALLLGLPAAWFGARREFRGRRLLSALGAVPFAVPPLLVAIGFVVFWGQSGAANRFLMWAFSLEEAPLAFLYGFWGLALAHGVYNFPIVMRMVSDLWLRLPPEQAAAARSLGAGELRVLFGTVLPQLAPGLASASSLVFLYSFFSFVIVLVFGSLAGSTLEAEIYRAARIQVEPGRASALALIGTAAALGMVALYALMERRYARSGRNHGAPRPREALRGAAERWGLAAYSLILAVIAGGPALSIVFTAFVERRGFSGQARLGLGNFAGLFRAGGLQSLGKTLGLGLTVALLACAAGAAAAWAGRRGKSRLANSVLPYLPLAVSPAVLALGWTSLMPRGAAGAFFAVALVQAAGAWPLAWRSIHGALSRIQPAVLESASSLGSSRADRVLRVELPLASRGLLSGAAFGFALSAGDAGSLLLAPIGGAPPLSLLMYRLAGSYRFNEACAAGLLIAAIAALAFAVREEAADAL